MAILEQYKKYSNRYPSGKKLSKHDVLRIIEASNDSRLWILHPLNAEWEVNADAGQVRKTSTKLILGHVAGNGYFKVWDSVAGKSRLRSHIILTAFISERPEGKTADHVNRYPMDDRLSNLRWADSKLQSENRDVPSSYSSRLKIQTAGTPLFETLIDDGLDREEACKKYCTTLASIRASIYSKMSLHGLFWRYVPEVVHGDEIWRPLTTYANRTLRSGYEVSNFGNFRNMWGHVSRGSLMKTTGYLRVSCLATDTGRKCHQVLVHQAVCRLFHGDAPTLQHTPDHIDRNRQNNKASNLRWALPCEQMNNRVFD